MFCQSHRDLYWLLPVRRGCQFWRGHVGCCLVLVPSESSSRLSQTKNNQLVTGSYLNVCSLWLAARPFIVPLDLWMKTFTYTTFIVISRALSSKNFYGMIQIMM